MVTKSLNFWGKYLKNMLKKFSKKTVFWIYNYQSLKRGHELGLN